MTHETIEEAVAETKRVLEPQGGGYGDTPMIVGKRILRNQLLILEALWYTAPGVGGPVPEEGEGT